MAEFPFNWQLQYTSNKHQKKNRYISSLKINVEWSLVCIWSQNDPYKPEFVEIRRNSTTKEILVSGNFKFMLNGQCLLQRKFMQLIEAGSATTQMELEYSSTSYYYSSYSISGTLIIPLDEAHKEYAKGVQFNSLLDLSIDFEGLLNSNGAFFSDVSVNCETVSFSAHKSILSVRSPVFAAMFSNEMKENQNNKVDITDLSPQTLKAMLTYIYSGKTGELSFPSAGELLYAADKYELKDLKRVCSDFLKRCISSRNVLTTLVLGELHDIALKVFAMDFICSTSEEFEVMEKTVEWKNLREKRPTLAMDVLVSLVKSKDQKLKSYK